MILPADQHEIEAAEIEAAASSWDVRLRSHACTDADRAAFKAWRDSDARHQATFARLQAALRTIRGAAEHPQLRALRERAEVMSRRSSLRRAAVRASIAAGLAMLAVTAVVLVRHRPILGSVGAEGTAVAWELQEGTAEHVYTTGRGERRTLALPDGSSATLNAATRIETQWRSGERRIHLVSGQALFSVSKDPTRPFVVTAGERTVTALGTAFDVRLESGELQVTLLEGRVAVGGLGRAAHQPVLELAPNQQLVEIVGEAPTVRVVDAVRSTGWAQGQVFFTDEALPAAVAEMNRSSTQEIVVGDPTLARYRVNGMFRSGNQDGFVSALTSYYPIDARRDDRGRIVLVPRREEH